MTTLPRVPMSYGTLLGPAMKITTEADAKEWFSEAVAWMKDVHNKEEEAAASILRSNLGYYAGYYDHDTRARVERLFSCAHPIFGAIAEKGAPSVEEAFAAGVRAGRSGR